MSDILTTLGENSTIKQSQADPVHCCLEGSYLNCPENPMKGDKSMCVNFMAQRCSRNWDTYCDTYLLELDQKNISGKYSDEFLTKVAESKYCRDDTSNPNSHCITSCEVLNPTAPGGAVTCKSVGDTIYRDKTQFYNISTNFAQNQGFDSTAPLKAAGCPKTCDLFNLTTFDNQDRVLNECLDRGTCQNILMDLAKNVKKNNIPISNTRFNDYINKFILTNPATQQSLAASLGNGSPTITTQQTTVPGPTNLITPTPPGVAPAANIRVERFDYPSQEPFAYQQAAAATQEKDDGIDIKLILIIGVVLFVLYKCMKK